MGETISTGCDNCGAVLQIAATERTANCPYCDHPSVVERPVSTDRPSPTFTVGFVLGQEAAFEKASSWIGSTSIFARSDFRKAPLEKIRAVYLPAYLYGALADTQYSADIGETYTETQTYTTTDSNGKTVTRTRTVTKTEWRPLSGQHDSYGCRSDNDALLGNFGSISLVLGARHPRHSVIASSPFQIQPIRPAARLIA